ncbi:PhzF family phenazine biosynthesis protein [Thalassotalea maritima]|uniref:PhzF family phenazine biosynthesis protein n=1 Tax=Thalassotalea maritima TaxID=3242416 RepID=UPI003527E085
MFVGEAAAGNPCGVIELSSWPSDADLLAITRKAELPVTSFFVKSGEQFHIRWFACDGEINLCGHGSLGAGAAIMAHYALEKVVLYSKYGDVLISQQDGLYTLQLPSWRGEPCSVPKLLTPLLTDVKDTFATRDLVFVMDSLESVNKFQPDDVSLKKVKEYHALIVTAQDGNNGYVLRYFAPKIGLSEDRATGSAQCSLAPYWFEKLGVDKLSVRQLSNAGGYFEVEQTTASSITIYAQATLRTNTIS